MARPLAGRLAAALAGALAIATPPGLRADDAGPHGDVAAIRHDAPILIAHWTNVPPRIDDVVVEGDDALAVWSGGARAGIATMHRRSARWWIVQNAIRTGPQRPVTAPELARELDVPGAVASLAAIHVTGIDDGVAPFQPPDADTGELRDRTDGFDAALVPPDPTALASLRFGGRAATPGEMPPTPGENGFYFYTLENRSDAPLALTGAALRVWFPFVLDPSRRYVTWLGFVEPEIRALHGSLRDNTLRFDLPAMTLTPGKPALGEIDGNAAPAP
ncbi:MAG TPA: hypothetical protein VMF61_06720 [Candidatus Acidoferrales bacterium]|nr:hypothetical protein [Candidatus Acidoferrales bacterium]